MKQSREREIDLRSPQIKSDYLDMIFQRNDDRSLEANIGFMALRCNQRVKNFWLIIRQIVRQRETGQKPAISGGDQRIVNKILFNPGIVGTSPDLRWGLFPSEICTQVYAIERNHQAGSMYRNHDIYAYHANLGGHYNSTKGRIMKEDAIQAAILMEKRHRSKIATG
uniref:Uncharacterized protein n=1 Tax=Octactis speculum TaxID=3111310 RepID=A0A7S2CKT8_9STRA|mmetsp:Transcript_36474/g.49330  ORF Transcript_36474/g.49330 Transcript_36474/m.49330 type:complete len:167 (+) Transcript_36474:133-633(+)|eukprot:CAMPEP_0185793150 /NCGR_PEP_ID=MMETSP1174-20130828/159315_1 /TAXON_ID=35687 /ORGANISM="Dictyocha speculum, Strain CCMP1381" /LENGTH=166 /DNA_ID=CAMNT_0028488267 /DNA_START=521 /DNA_END=1021 /DNA_ORIENTATION=-